MRPANPRRHLHRACRLAARESALTGLTATRQSTTLALQLRSILRRAVIDETGLAGYYHFAFDFGATELNAPSPADSDKPSIFTALQEQLKG